MSINSYNQTFNTERIRLMSALGELVEGGVIEAIRHIGSTAILGADSGGCVDIGIAIWPFPLDAVRVQQLASRGYSPVAGFETGDDIRYSHADGTVQLLFAEAGGERWPDYLLVTDYLHAHPEEVRAGSARDFDVLTRAARQWHIDAHGYEPLNVACAALKSLPCPWWISSGWAIDLHLGSVTRVHHDIDIGVARSDQFTVRSHMSRQGWRWVTPFENDLKPWPDDLWLELPQHQAHCHKDGRMLDFLLTEIENGLWRYRRDTSIVRDAKQTIFVSNTGVSYLAPEIVLLYKSSGSRGIRMKDQADFMAVKDHLNVEQIKWLRSAIEASQANHAWGRFLEV